MDNLKDKTFKDNRTGDVVRVIDSFENIAILENKEKIDVRKLTNPLYYTEQIDPRNFFNNQNTYNSLAEKIKSIPMENVRDDGEGSPVQIQVDGNNNLRPSTDESAVIMSSEDEEKAELAKKYGISIDNTQSLAKQNEALSKFIDPEDMPPVTQIIQHPVSNPSDKIQKIEVDRDGGAQRIVKEDPIIRIEDPIISMFKNVKRTTDFSISLDVRNKIPRVDFIEMMEDSYEMSIIDFLSEEFTQNLLKNPHIIRNMISEKIKEMVYGKEKKIEKPEPPKSQIIKEGKDPVPRKRSKKEPVIDPTKVIKRDPLIIREDKEFPEKKPKNEK